MRVPFPLAAALLALAGTAAAGPPDSRLSARFQNVAGRSGKLLAFVETREGISELARAGLPVTITQPGVYPLPWPEGWPKARTKTGMSIILLTPFSDKRDGRIGAYVLGTWPNEGGTKGGSTADAYASTRAAYALPPGFIKVTKATAATRVSESFRLRDFLTKDQPNVWPKYLVLDLKLVDKLELVIAALREAGHPVKGLHVMSGFRTPRYNAREVGKGRSAVSRHIYGDAADVYPDDDGNGRIDDLNGDGRIDLADARIVAAAAEAVEAAHPDLAGGISIYPATAAHGPVVHVDVRGTRARW